MRSQSRSEKPELNGGIAAKRVPSGASSPRRYLPVSSPDARGKYGTTPMRNWLAAGTISRSTPRRSRLHSFCVATNRGWWAAVGDVVGVGKLPRGEVRGPEVADLAGVHQVGERPERLLDRACPGPAGAAGRGRCSRCRAGAGCAPRRGRCSAVSHRAGSVPSTRRAPELGGDDRSSRRPRQRLAEELLGPSRLRRRRSSAVSKKVMPASKAASTTAFVPASSMRMPKLLQPMPTADTHNPESPIRRSSMTVTFARRNRTDRDGSEPAQVSRRDLSQPTRLRRRPHEARRRGDRPWSSAHDRTTTA